MLPNTGPFEDFLKITATRLQPGHHAVRRLVYRCDHRIQKTGANAHQAKSLQVHRRAELFIPLWGGLFIPCDIMEIWTLLSLLSTLLRWLDEARRVPPVRQL
jgi:hypothetical protein